MESHFSHQVSRPDTVSKSENFTPGVEMSPRLNALHAIAKKYYVPLETVAAESDNAQEYFTSAGEHYVAGARLTAMMALRAAALTSERSA